VHHPFGLSFPYTPDARRTLVAKHAVYMHWTIGASGCNQIGDATRWSRSSESVGSFCLRFPQHFPQAIVVSWNSMLNLEPVMTPSSVAEMPGYHVCLHRIGAKITSIVVGTWDLISPCRPLIPIAHGSCATDTIRHQPASISVSEEDGDDARARRSLVSLLSPAFQLFNAAASL